MGSKMNRSRVFKLPLLIILGALLLAWQGCAGGSYGTGASGIGAAGTGVKKFEPELMPDPKLDLTFPWDSAPKEKQPEEQPPCLKKADGSCEDDSKDDSE